ncbi:DnaJ domain-containing protein [Leptolyngbya sp. AN02str]|uniref:J domain-containing protein n=1 Tax=Leptolyngbya sp. AN02str TaxID=3423363 RepID=UPI003D310BE9
MLQTPFSSEWLQKFSDPYAVLGLSVTADDRRVLKRYRDVAKLLHPDSLIQADVTERETASRLFSRLVSPSYQKLKQDKGRAEYLAMLRFKVRRINRDTKFEPKHSASQRLLSLGPAQVDVFYEQAIAKLAEPQFESLSRFELFTPQLEELNLVYLKLKMGEPIIREKRSGLISASQTAPVEIKTTPADPDKPVVDYAQRHYDRAMQYARQSNWAMVVREMQDAIKISPKTSDYHSLLAKAYLMQELPTMAKVHFRQALKLNPQDALALQYASKLQISIESTSPLPNGSKPAATKPKSGGLGSRFSLFGRKP